MIVFKTTFKIVKKYIFTILLYTAILILFTIVNFQTSESSTNFEATKPDIIIINNDEEVGVTENLVKYLNEKCNVKDITLDSEKINDALFYRDISYIVRIPKNYRNDFLNGKNPIIEIEKTGDYEASIAERVLNKYLKISNIYLEEAKDEQELILMTNETLKEEVKTEITSKLDSNSMAQASFYYSFLNYSVLAGCVYVLCLILSSFKETSIKKRTNISSMSHRAFNRKLLASTSVVAIIMWVIYIIIGCILLNKVMFTLNGILFIINSFLFTICALTIAFLIGNVVNNKNAINGIINVVALGSSFLCGAFVPMELLPKYVLDFAHLLPSYWYIKNNEIIKVMEDFDFVHLKPIIINMFVIMIFIIMFIIITNLITSKRNKSN